MTVSRPCYFGNLLLGVVGVDVNLAYILEDVTYYQDSLASYTFLIDNKGQWQFAPNHLKHRRSLEEESNSSMDRQSRAARTDTLAAR